MDLNLNLTDHDTQCLVCTRPFSLSSPPIDSLSSLAICPDCKQTVLIDPLQTQPVTPNPTRYRRTRTVIQSSRTRSADDSDPDSFAHNFSQIMNSARWQAVVTSEDESELDTSSELDASSYGPFGPDSDAYMSDREFFSRFDNVNFNNNNNYNNVNSNNDENYDIDPMQAGNWDTEEESEWEEISELDENLNPIINTPRNPTPNSNPNPNLSPQWMRSRWRMGPLQIDITQPFVTNQGDYLDSNQFEELLEQLAEESDDVRTRGPLGTSASFRERIPKVVITREMVRRESGEIICAVCKDAMSLGIRVSKLPCQHLYHDECIEPWLKNRNTCPVCRYELPVDSKSESGDSESDEESEFEEEFEEEQVVVLERETRERSEDNGERGGWLFLAPIVSLVGIVLVLCFSNGGNDRNVRNGGNGRNGEDLGNGRNNGEAEEGRKRWWSIF